MNLENLKKHHWADDEDAELAWDAMMAEKYGFYVKSITAARNDLILYLVLDNPNLYEDFEVLRSNLSKIQKRMLRDAEDLDRLITQLETKVVDKYRIKDINDGIDCRIRRINEIKNVLPRKMADIKGRAVTYLIAIWVHEARIEGYDGTRTIKLTFDDEDNRQHKSICFIFEMLAHFSDEFLSGVTSSTIRRAWKKVQNKVPKPEELIPHQGDPIFFS